MMIVAHMINNENTVGRHKLLLTPTASRPRESLFNYELCKGLHGGIDVKRKYSGEWQRTGWLVRWLRQR